MRLKLHALFYLFLLSVCITKGQNIPIGEWLDHLPYKTTVSVTASDENVYCATPYSLFYYNKNDNSVNRMTRISGLSDIGISVIGFNKEMNTLLVAYSNANIDLVKDNAIINMRDIIGSEAITPAEKSINNMMYIGNLAYLSCGFGIVVIDLEKIEISDTYFIGPNGNHLKVLDLTYNDTSFFAATENGIYTADIDSPNLAFFGSWSKDQSLPDTNATYNAIAVFQGKIFANKYSEVFDQDTLYYYDNSQWIENPELFVNSDVMRLKVYNDQLYVVYRYFAYGFDSDLTKITDIWVYNYQSGPTLKDLTVDEGTIWLADEQFGMVKRIDEWTFEFIYPNGPDNADVYSMSTADNIVYSVPGGRDLSWNSIYKYASISSLIEGEWNTFDRYDLPAIDTMYDLLSVAVNPYNPAQVFAGSWYGGMVELINGQVVNTYGPENSGLDYKNNELPRCNVGGLAFDESGNLWATSSHANNALSVRIPSSSSSLGEWHSFNLGTFSSSMELGPLMIDSYGQKWIITRETKPIIVFNDNGTITNTSDDRVKELTSATGNGALPGEKVFSMAEDKDGEVWIGTDEGIGVFYSPNNIFSSGYNFDAQRILIPRNDGSGLADILLEFETVTAIAIDGDNNKWIGTDRSGVFHLSPDGQEELHHFTEQNSPLFSNNIGSIAITKDGEVFIGTSKGIISYRGTASEVNPTFEDVYAYPNPVSPGYSGTIAIKGLVDKTSYKITDISGTLIYSGMSEGGQAVWNGSNFSGRRAQSGVYLVYLTDENGSEKLVTKILFVN
jgi:hypothetical protein